MARLSVLSASWLWWLSLWSPNHPATVQTKFMHENIGLRQNPRRTPISLRWKKPNVFPVGCLVWSTGAGCPSLKFLPAVLQISIFLGMSEKKQNTLNLWPILW